MTLQVHIFHQVLRPQGAVVGLWWHVLLSSSLHGAEMLQSSHSQGMKSFRPKFTTLSPLVMAALPKAAFFQNWFIKRNPLLEGIDKIMSAGREVGRDGMAMGSTKNGLPPGFVSVCGYRQEKQSLVTATVLHVAPGLPHYSQELQQHHKPLCASSHKHYTFEIHEKIQISEMRRKISQSYHPSKTTDSNLLYSYLSIMSMSACLQK